MRPSESAPLPSSPRDPALRDPAPGRPGASPARRGRSGWALRLAGTAVAASAAAAIHAGCCNRPPCGPPPAEPCPTVTDGGTTDGPPSACPTIEEIASGQRPIPPVGTCAVGHWICALAGDLPAVMGQPTFVPDATYEGEWRARVQDGWLALTAHLQAVTTDQQAVNLAAWSLESKLKDFTADAAARKSLVEEAYWQPRLRDLYDAAKAAPGMEPPCGRP